MKKEYKKPVVILESFALATSIAGDCEVKTHTPSQNECGMDFSGVQIFMAGMDGENGCSGIAVDNLGGDGEYNGICYHVPNDGLSNLFNS